MTKPFEYTVRLCVFICAVEQLKKTLPHLLLISVNARVPLLPFGPQLVET